MKTPEEIEELKRQKLEREKEIQISPFTPEELEHIKNISDKIDSLLIEGSTIDISSLIEKEYKNSGKELSPLKNKIKIYLIKSYLKLGWDIYYYYDSTTSLVFRSTSTNNYSGINIDDYDLKCVNYTFSLINREEEKKWLKEKMLKEEMKKKEEEDRKTETGLQGMIKIWRWKRTHK